MRPLRHPDDFLHNLETARACIHDMGRRISHEQIGDLISTPSRLNRPAQRELHGARVRAGERETTETQYLR